ncbi:sigma-54 dependent transcriptional regulator [Halobacteriovorax sp. HLS]|uniref:sigma-54-dependent transcriptional regulator n=1 Tax=Halobacteriovorax sp. HLS TaxID=2234000 RepID=UPI000FD918A9|nr:sigma-54 dependent transcriptional regulator [Halobacteriovorax sp. HLS]
MEKELILLVDDDRGILESSEILLSDEFEICTASSVSEAKNRLKEDNIQIAVVDLNFEGHEQDGLSLIDHMTKEHHQIPFIVLSGDKDTKRVVEATKRPLVEFVTKDGDHDETLRIAIRKGILKRKELEAQKIKGFQFKTKSKEIKKIFRSIDKLLQSNSNASILINGESGTGKEYMAKYISNFLGKRLVAANMASIPKETAESELFGHTKGAFTGATSNKIGLLEQAHNGVFFLDEIGDCSPEIQSKLLRAIQEKEVMPVGSTVPRKVNLRFIAATHHDLDNLVAEGEFRLDLQQRLNTFIFKLPALRNRHEDIDYYATMFINELSNGDYYNVVPSAYRALKEYHWPGNVRELRNIIERALVFTDRRTIDDVIVYKALNISAPKMLEEIKPKFHYEKLKEAEIKSNIIDALNTVKGNKVEGAKVLGVHISTLHRWIKRYDLEELIPHISRGRPSSNQVGI